MAPQNDSAAYRAMIAEGFELAREEGTTPEQATRWLRRHDVARKIMGSEAFDAMVEDMVQAMKAAGKNPWNKEDDDGGGAGTRPDHVGKPV